MPQTEVATLKQAEISYRLCSSEDLQGGNQHACALGIAVRAWCIAIAIAYVSASFVGVRFPDPNLDGTRSSGAMEGVVPPPIVNFDDSISRFGSCTMIMNPGSARRAETGLVFPIRMLA